MPRAPVGKAAQAPDPDAAGAKGKLILLGILGVVLLVAGGIYWYGKTHNPETRASNTRDSLRALAAGPVGPDTTKFVAPNDYSPIRRARALQGSLASMLRGSRGAVLGWAAGPIDTTATDRATQRRNRQYLAFANRWQQRLDALTRGGTEFSYGPGVRFGPQMENVTHQLEAVVSVMRDMIRLTEVKPRSERTADLRAAEGYLRSAGTVLSNLPR